MAVVDAASCSTQTCPENSTLIVLPDGANNNCAESVCYSSDTTPCCKADDGYCLLSHSAIYEWNVTILSEALTATTAGTSVTQTNAHGTNNHVGKLAVALDGSSTTTIIIRSAVGQNFDTDANLVIGGASGFTVARTKLVSATTNQGGATQPTIVGDMAWTVTISSEALTATTAGTSVIQTHVQTDAVGTLNVALDGSATTTITIRSAIGQPFDTKADLVIGGSSGFTVAQANLVSATSSQETACLAVVNALKAKCQVKCEGGSQRADPYTADADGSLCTSNGGTYTGGAQEADPYTQGAS